MIVGYIVVYIQVPIENKLDWPGQYIRGGYIRGVNAINDATIYATVEQAEREIADRRTLRFGESIRNIAYDIKPLYVDFDKADYDPVPVSRERKITPDL